MICEELENDLHIFHKIKFAYTFLPELKIIVNSRRLHDALP